MSTVDILLAEANENFKIVKVKFAGATTNDYTYKTTFNVEEGDKVVVDVNGEFKVVTVISVEFAAECDLNFNFQVKWLVSKIDIEEYEKCKETEREANRHINKLRYSSQRKELLDNLAESVGKKGLATVRGLVRL